MTGSQRALLVARVGYGAVLLFAPGAVIRLAAGRPSGRGAAGVVRVLGARHLVQAALTAAFPGPAAFALGAGVDAVHAASMLALAAVSPPARRAALTDVLPEAAFAAFGFLQ